MSFPIFKSLRDFYENYEMPLARALFHVSNRGLLVDQGRLLDYKNLLEAETNDCLEKASSVLGKEVVGVGSKSKTGVKIASPAAVLKAIKSLNIEIPKTRKGKIWVEDSTGATTLQRIFAKTGNEFVWQVIRHRELQEMRSFSNVQLLDSILYSTYKATGTKSGRRSSSENYLGLGTNGQNLPKHSKLGMQFRRCIVARPGKIFIFCDQKGAEDWIVHAIIADQTEGRITVGVDELQKGINRHRKLASLIFSKPEDEIEKSSIEYFLGKKTRHAGNYGMRGQTYSDQLASKGIHIPATACDFFLEKFHKAEPWIQQVFQAYVEQELTTRRSLTTPIGRYRDFLSLRSYSDNSKIFRDAYSYIPQSTVGDNTGLAILGIENASPGIVVADHHDAIGTEVENNIDTIVHTVNTMSKAFDREIVFPKGFSIRIPVEFEMGFNLGEMKTCEDLSRVGLTSIWNTLNPHPSRPDVTISGAQQLQSQQV